KQCAAARAGGLSTRGEGGRPRPHADSPVPAMTGRTGTSANLSRWSLRLIRVTGVKQPPAQRHGHRPPRGWSSRLGADDGSSHDDELDAISRQTAAGAAGPRTDSAPDPNT